MNHYNAAFNRANEKYKEQATSNISIYDFRTFSSLLKEELEKEFEELEKKVTQYTYAGGF